MDDRRQESKKTVVAFVAGLLIGGLLVWLFSGPGQGSAPTKKSDSEKDTKTAVEKTDEDTSYEEEDKESGMTGTTTAKPQSAGTFSIANQAAGMKVSLENVDYPSEEGWIVVHDDIDGEPGRALGAARYHTGVGLMPKEVDLLRATEKGKTYLVIFYAQNGDKEFDLKIDTPMMKDGKLLSATFTAQ